MKVITYRKIFQTIVDSSEQELYKLNSAQRQAIEAGRKEIENGNLKTGNKLIYLQRIIELRSNNILDV